VQIERHGNSVRDNSVKIVKKGVVSGIEKVSGGGWPNNDSIKSYGADDDLWELPWTTDDINSVDFGVAISAKASGNATASIDNIQITVYYAYNFTTISCEAIDVTQNPAAAANNDSIGSVAWLSPQYVFSNDNVNYATAVLTSGNSSQYLVATNFGLSIPNGSDINGIRVRIDKHASDGRSITDNSVKIVKDGVINGDEQVDARRTRNWTTRDRDENYGGGRDLWGLAWISDDINSVDFGVAISAKSSGDATASIDNIQITVYYTNNNLTTCGVRMDEAMTAIATFNTATPKYKCLGTSCVRDDTNGAFLTSDCDNACTATPKYKCSGTSCVRDDTNGTYTNSNCNNVCRLTLPLPGWTEIPPY
jgi:hypothetical protein